MGTLQVQEAMGMKVDREAVATLVLPQLWVMAMGPRAYLLTSFPHISLVLTLDVHGDQQSSTSTNSPASWASSKNSANASRKNITSIFGTRSVMRIDRR